MPDESGNSEMATYYAVSGIPTVILVDREGKVVSVNARGPELGKLLETLPDSDTERGMRAAPYLPSIGPLHDRNDIEQMCTMGMADGTLHAQNRPKLKGGMLRDYLTSNIRI